MIKKLYLNEEFILSLYKKYKWNLYGQWKYYRKHKKKYGRQQDIADCEICYMLIRETKPRVVVEISCGKGHGTQSILKALYDNRVGHLHSFEINPRHLEIAKQNAIDLGFKDLFSFYLGDVKVTFPKVIDKIGIIDYLFIDSSHKEDFGYWWKNNVLKYVRKNGLVSVHDIRWYKNGPYHPTYGEFKAVEEIMKNQDLTSYFSSPKSLALTWKKPIDVEPPPRIGQYSTLSKKIKRSYWFFKPKQPETFYFTYKGWQDF